MVTLIVRPPAPNRPQQSSPFLKLPPELRVIIYEMAARHSAGNAVDISLKMDLPVILIRNTGGFALLHTCHTIRNESIDIVMSFLRLKADKFRAESTRLHTEGAVSYYTPNSQYGDYLTKQKALSQMFARARILWIAADRLDRLIRDGTRKSRSASSKRRSTFKLHSSPFKLRRHA